MGIQWPPGQLGPRPRRGDDLVRDVISQGVRDTNVRDDQAPHAGCRWKTEVAMLGEAEGHRDVGVEGVGVRVTRVGVDAGGDVQREHVQGGASRALGVHQLYGVANAPFEGPRRPNAKHGVDDKGSGGQSAFQGGAGVVVVADNGNSGVHREASLRVVVRARAENDDDHTAVPTMQVAGCHETVAAVVAGSHNEHHTRRGHFL